MTVVAEAEIRGHWLAAEIRHALDDESVQEKLRAAGVQPRFGVPDEITRMLGVSR